MKIVILVDMDGVLCNWPKAVADLYGVDYNELLSVWPAGEYEIEHGLRGVGVSVTEEQIWEVVFREGASFWEGMELYPWTHDLVWVARTSSDEWAICTSPGRAPSSPAGKYAWMQKHLGEDFRRFAITPKKHLLARPGTILIDDSQKKCAQFRAEGGSAILFPQVWNTLDWDQDLDPMRDVVLPQLEEIGRSIDETADAEGIFGQ